MEDIKYRIHFDPAHQNSFGLEILLPDGGALMHLPDEFFHYIEALNEGLPQLIDQDKEVWASSRKGEMRQA